MSTSVWEEIDKEKTRDKWVRRISISAWCVTGFMLLCFAGIVMTDVVRMLSLVGNGAAPLSSVVRAVTPLVAAVGSVSLLIAVLATIGMFFRLRTASLTEIQVRLAALEGMLADDAEE